MVYENEESEREQAINEWLPVTSKRDAKWWYSAFHNVTAMVGAGVLSLPYAMAQLGWGPGVTIMVLSWVVTLYTLWQMVQMHEMVPGKRFDRYHELGQYAFGEKLRLWIVVPQQLTVDISSDIVYMVTGGQSLKKFHDLVCPNCKKIRQTFYHDFCFGPLCSFPSSELKLHIRCLAGCCSHVIELLHHCLGSFGCKRCSARRRLLEQGFDHRRKSV
ncbi:hypothetical protein V6N13_135110 [Hibiscus sabdariffa]